MNESTATLESWLRDELACRANPGFDEIELVTDDVAFDTRLVAAALAVANVALAFPDRIRGVELNRAAIEAAAMRAAPRLLDWVPGIVRARAELAGLARGVIAPKWERGRTLEVATIRWGVVLARTALDGLADPRALDSEFEGEISPAIAALHLHGGVARQGRSRLVVVPALTSLAATMGYAAVCIAENRHRLRDHVHPCGYQHPTVTRPHVFLDARTGGPGPGAQYCCFAHRNRQKQVRLSATENSDP